MANANYLVSDLVSELRIKNYDVDYQKYTRNGINEERLVWHDDSLETGIDLNISDFISSYDFMSLDAMVQLIIDEFERQREINKKFDKEFVLDNIRIALRNPISDYTVKKESLFKNVQQYLCLFGTDTGIGPNMEWEVLVSDIFLKTKGIAIDEAWARAEKNNRKKIYITTPDCVYMSIDSNSKQKLQALGQYAYEKIEMYFVTNDEFVYGAASILNTDALKEVLKNAVDNMKPSFLAKNHITTDALKDGGATRWQVIFISKDKAILVPKNANELTRATLEIVMKNEQRGLQKKDKISDEMFEILL